MIERLTRSLFLKIFLSDNHNVKVDSFTVNSIEFYEAEKNSGKDQISVQVLRTETSLRYI